VKKRGGGGGGGGIKVEIDTLILSRDSCFL